MKWGGTVRRFNYRRRFDYTRSKTKVGWRKRETEAEKVDRRTKGQWGSGKQSTTKTHTHTCVKRTYPT